MFLSGLLNILNSMNRVSCNMQIRLVVLSNAHVPQLTVSLYLLLYLQDDTEVWIVWAWRDDDADNKLNLDLKHTYRRVSSRKYNLIKLAGSTANQAGSSGALVYAFLALVTCALYM